MEQENYIDFHITQDQANKIAEHFGYNIDNLAEDYEICELLDRIIDEL